MEFKKDVKYNIDYVDMSGNTKQSTFIPNKDMSIAGVINDFKNKTANFLKILKVRGGQKMDENKNQYITLFDLIKGEDEGIIVKGKNSELNVYYEFQDNEDSAYNKYLTQLAKELKLISYEIKDVDSTAVVDIKSYIEKHFDMLDAVLDVNASNKEEEIQNIADFMMEGVICGGLASSTYEQLLQDNKITESEDLTTTVNNIENAIESVEEITETEEFSVKVTDSNIDVLIADEKGAIDGYKAFLEQIKDTMLPTLFDVIKTEIEEIIADEEEHINKLQSIQMALDVKEEEKVEDVVEPEDKITESKELPKYKLNDMFMNERGGVITIDTPTIDGRIQYKIAPNIDKLVSGLYEIKIVDTTETLDKILEDNKYFKIGIYDYQG